MRRDLTDEASAVALIASATGAWIYKHSATCGVSMQALEEIDRFLARHPQEEVGMLVVQSQRALSNALASRFGVSHQSPQLFLVRGGTVLWHASHYRITAEAMVQALERAARSGNPQ